MKNWLNSRGNDGRARWITGGGGLPKKGTGVWTNGNVPGFMYQNVCITQSMVYAMGAGRVVALNAIDGKEQWHVTLPRGRESAPAGLAVGDDVLAAGSSLLNLDDGELLQDIELKSKQKVALLTNTYVALGGVLRALDDGSIYLVTRDGDTRTINEPLQRLVVDESGRYLLGWHDGKLICFDIESGKRIWQVALPMARNSDVMSATGASVSSGSIFIQVNFDSLWCLDLETGESIWRCGDENVNQDRARLPTTPNVLIAAPDRVYLVKTSRDNGTFNGYDRTTGELEFESQMNGVDLVFGYDDVLIGNDEKNMVVAWDRYNGAEVYRAPQSISQVANIAGAGGRIIVNNQSGSMACIEIAKAYKSKNRPS